MKDLRESLLQEAEGLPAAPAEAVEAFAREAAGLAVRVRSARAVLSGVGATEAPDEGEDLERDHAEFMRRLLEVGDFRLLVPVLPSVYAATRARGLPDDDNRLMADVWMQALGVSLPAEQAGPLREVYRWMRDHHEDWIRLADAQRTNAPKGSAAWNETRAELTADLVRGDQRAVLSLVQRFAVDPPALRDLYTEVVTPAMYEIGALWEAGELSVTEEHRASEIMSRTVDICCPALTGRRHHTKGRALITCAPGEHHRLGSRIVSDLLEFDGWDVTYLGESAPAVDTADLAEGIQPHIIGISVAMPFNLPRLAALIRDLHARPKLENARIVVGGWLLVLDPDLWRILGADGGSVDAGGAVDAAAALWEGMRPGA